MKTTLHIISLVGKGAGFLSACGAIPLVNPATGIIIFAASSLVKDVANRLGDLLDDGKPNNSFR